MTKEELEKKFNEIVENHYKQSGHAPTEWAVINFKDGFDSAVALLLPRLEEAEKVIQFYGDVEQMYDCVYENEGPCIGYVAGDVTGDYDDFGRVEGRRTKHHGKRARQYLEKKNE